MKPIDDYKQQIEAWKLDVAALREENARLRDEVERQRRLTISSTEAGVRVIESLDAEMERLRGLICAWADAGSDDTATGYAAGLALMAEVKALRGVK